MSADGPAGEAWSLDSMADSLARIANDVDECATLRDRFAMASLTLLDDHRDGLKTKARMAYEMADAMLAAREGK